MTAEIIDGTAVEIVPEVRAVQVVQQPGQALVAAKDDPAGMVAVATRLANVLADIVERKRLYAQIGNKKYPTVEAWMTIARLDNVVARESRQPVKNEDGSWEAFAEIVRLSDGMVIGSSSALCGDPQDSPWNKRADYQRRAMAQTRATSRAFRQHYSWIMSLAGYEPTPADEMPGADSPVPPAPASVRSSDAGGAPVTPEGQPEAYLSEPGGSWTGDVEVAKPPTDATLRQSSSGSAFGFVILEPNGAGRPKRLQVIVTGTLAEALDAAWDNPEQITVEGDLWKVPWSDKDGNAKPPYRQVRATRVVTPDWTLPAPDGAVPTPVASSADLSDLDSLPW